MFQWFGGVVHVSAHPGLLTLELPMGTYWYVIAVYVKTVVPHITILVGYGYEHRT